MKTAKFSNGHTDAYKGRRPVTAAWMIITPTGEIVSGHSLTAEIAAKTAKNKAGELSGLDMPSREGMGYASYYQWWLKRAGVSKTAELETWINLRRQARIAYAEECKIEVVDL